MFITLLAVTFLVTLTTSFIISNLFKKTIYKILNRIISEDLGSSVGKYILFAIYVVGISGGVRIWELERYITSPSNNDIAITLTGDRWILEIYRTIIETLQGIAWMLLVFFLITLIAYVIVRGFEQKRNKTANE